MTWCAVHVRPLTLREQDAGGCCWCEPARAPKGHAIRRLAPDEVAALAPGQQRLPGRCGHGNPARACPHCPGVQA